MNSNIFKTIADSLRQYRRAELTDFAIGSEDIIDRLYTDPISNNAILQTVLSPNTTFIIGRKGTGKSTIFAKAQREIRNSSGNISAYIDVKSLYDANQTVVIRQKSDGIEIDEQSIQTHLLRKRFISAILHELIQEVKKLSKSVKLLQRVTGQKKKFDSLLQNLEGIETDLHTNGSMLRPHELPILQTISNKHRQKEQESSKTQKGVKAGGKAKSETMAINATVSAEISKTDEALLDEEIFKEYTEVLYRSFPFSDIICQITDLLTIAGLHRIYVFFDDFSELSWINQRLFVDVVLSPLNNTSNERIKLKVAAYPGRVYFGKIDPTKIDEISLDFFDLYRSPRLPDIELAAIDYTKRLIEKRFSYYGVVFEDYFDKQDLDEIFYLLFAVTFNIPRILGYIFYYCYLDRVARGRQVNRQAIVSASQRYYQDKLLPYFNLNRYALEPYDQKLDKYNQKVLLDSIVDKAKTIRRQILTQQVSGSLFKGLPNPPTSHFVVSNDMEELLSSLELNTFVTKYHQMRDKDGKDISVYALYYGLTANERLDWGYPKRQRYDKDYFKQRIFNYNSALHEFLTNTQMIKCQSCGAAFPMEQVEKIEYFKWHCPTCFDGICRIIKLDDKFKLEISQLNREILLEPVELEILHTLHDEIDPMRAKEISLLLDITYQLVGKRTDKLQDMGYVKKVIKDNHKYNQISDSALNTYFK